MRGDVKGREALSGAPAPDSPFCRCATSSPGAGEVFPLRESQAVKFITKVLGITRTLPAVLLALPLGELSPQVTERAHAVDLDTKGLGIMRKFSAVLLALPLGELSPKVTERASPPYGLFAPFTTFQ